MRNLDRTYRPQRFVDVLGQKKSTDALRDQIASPEPRPVLITGPLGTGKTTLGLPRPMLRILEKVGQQGPISESNVRLTLDLDIFGILSKFSAALLEGESQEQIRIIDDWTGLASRKLELIHEFFVHIYLSQVQGVDRENPVMQGFPADIQEKISRGIAERARRLNLDPDVFWQDIIAKLEPREGINDSQLAMIVSGLDRLLRQPALLGSTKVEVKSASRRLRISKSTSAMTTAQYLSGRQLRSLWQAGSFLPQNYGMLFNLRLTIRHAGVGIAGHRAGTSLISRLTHQLGMRLEEWSANDPAQYHWIYQHESDCDRHLITRVILAVYLCCYKPTEIHLSRGPAFRSPRSARSEVSSVLLPVLGLNIDF